MKSSRRWVRMLRIGAAAVVLLVLGLAAFVNVQQRVLRWRAERLLADIRAIQMGKSTWADAQRLMTKWGARGAYEGSCTAASCDYQIALQDAFRRFPVFFMPSGRTRDEGRDCCDLLFRPYRWLGGRSAFVAARFIVRDGIIWGKDFSLAVEVRPDENSEHVGYLLMGSAATVSHFSTLSHSLEETLLHPEYEVRTPGACEGCAAVFARFTPFADPKVIDAALADFNLECLTRRKPCIDPSDVMPKTWSGISADSSRPVDPKTIDNCQFPKELLGRDDRNVAIGEVVSTRWVRESSRSQEWVTFRWVKQIKGLPFRRASESRDTPISPGLVSDLGIDRIGMVRPRRRFIVAFDNRLEPGEGQGLDIPPCGIIPLTEGNLADVERGIRRDVLPVDSIQWPY